MGEKRERKYKSKKDTLLKKAKEAMLAATQIYNNPHITFKTETFITLSVISWTYLMHAFYESSNIDYSYYKRTGKRKQYDKTKYGAIKKWELDRCLNEDSCPLSIETKVNLRFIIGLRHEIEHQMTTCIDNTISAKFQSCALNFNYYIVNLFGKKYSLDNELALSIQFSGIDPIKQKELSKMKGLSPNIYNYISEFEKDLDTNILLSKEYSYKVMYIPVNVNKRGQADSVIEFVKVTDDVAEQVKNLVMIKESEKKKYLPQQIVDIMKSEGYLWFTINKHTVLWQNNGKSLKIAQYGSIIAGKQWYWYESWLNYVRKYCQMQQNMIG